MPRQASPIWSLQQGLQWRVLGAVVALWLGVASYAWYSLDEEVDNLLDGHLAQGMALLMALQVQDHEFDEMLGVDHLATPNDGTEGKPPSWSGSEAAELALHRYATKAVFQVWYQGQLLLRSSDAPNEALAALHPGFSDTVVKGVTWRVYTAPAIRPDSYVIMGESREARAEIMSTLLRKSWLPMLAGLPLVALAIWLAVRQGLVPVVRLGTQVSARKPDALDPIAVHESPRELVPLIAALNQLFVRMGSSLESERRFTADAAHELRTPIAGIRAQAQAALEVQDAAQRRQALLGTLAGCDHAAHLVDQLLQLARLEGARASATPGELTDVFAVVRNEVAELASSAFESGHELVLDTGERRGPWLMAGDPVLLGALLRNLVDNALRYTPPQSTVQITLEAPDAQGRLAFTVEDNGPGLAPAVMQRLGERFFRARETDAPGSGLGWSIVRRIALALSLDVAIDRAPELGGLRVRVSWMPAQSGAVVSPRHEPSLSLPARRPPGALAAAPGLSLRREGG
jgi:two-component system, OmpR family, sensor histidine kinase QseC